MVTSLTTEIYLRLPSCGTVMIVGGGWCHGTTKAADFEGGIWREGFWTAAPQGSQGSTEALSTERRCLRKCSLRGTGLWRKSFFWGVWKLAKTDKWETDSKPVSQPGLATSQQLSGKARHKPAGVQGSRKGKKTFKHKNLLSLRFPKCCGGLMSELE